MKTAFAFGKFFVARVDFHCSHSSRVGIVMQFLKKTIATFRYFENVSESVFLFGPKISLSVENSHPLLRRYNNAKKLFCRVITLVSGTILPKFGFSKIIFTKRGGRTNFSSKSRHVLMWSHPFVFSFVTNFSQTRFERPLGLFNDVSVYSWEWKWARKRKKWKKTLTTKKRRKTLTTTHKNGGRFQLVR